MLYHLGYALSGPAARHQDSTLPAGYLDAVLASACCDLDATIADSYAGTGQSWVNLIASPADGAAQTVYDFSLGAGSGSSSDDPAFTGSAGDSAAYFLLDGNDLLTQKNTAGGSVIQKAHRSDQTGVWFALAFRSSPAIAGYLNLLGNGGTAGNEGFRFAYNTNENLEIRIKSNALQTITPGLPFAADTDYLLVISWDATDSSADGLRVWLNATTAVSAAHNIGTNIADCTRQFDVGAAYGTLTVNNGTRIYAFSCGNEFLDDTKAGLLFSVYGARHGRSYA